MTNEDTRKASKCKSEGPMVGNTKYKLKYL